MSESLVEFFKTSPFWAIVIIVFMVLPIIGAVLHIFLKAFGRRGIDDMITMADDRDHEGIDSTQRNKEEEKKGLDGHSAS